jgi:hypothetical protein
MRRVSNFFFVKMALFGAIKHLEVVATNQPKKKGL